MPFPDTPSPVENINCPCCNQAKYSLWSSESGFKVVRCNDCRLLFVNPRPKLQTIQAAVQDGEQLVMGKKISVKSRRIPKKVSTYKKSIGRLFSDIWKAKKPITWLDVGSGYGETLQAVAELTTSDSLVFGCEPMKHKAETSRKHGLTVHNCYLGTSQYRVDFISSVDTFSHIPDFNGFLEILASNLAPNGEIFIETGNLADLSKRNEFPGELGLPDHLVFAGESQLERYLRGAGFTTLKIERERIDGFMNFAKNLLKILLG